MMQAARQSRVRPPPPDLLQVDQAEPVDQAFLRQLHQCRQVSNLDRRLRLSHRHHRQEATEPPGITTALAEYF